MIDTRNRILAIAATVSVASSLSATCVAEAGPGVDGPPIVTMLAESRESQTKDGGDRRGGKVAPPPSAPSTTRATPSSDPAVWSDRDKTPRR